MDESKIAAWNDSDLTNLPIYEPDLKVVERNRNRNLFFQQT